MQHHKRSFSRFSQGGAHLVGVLTLLFSFVAGAAPQVQVTPAVSNLSIGQDHRLSLRWQLTNVADNSAQLRSTEGRLVDANSGQLILRVPRALASTVPASVNEVLTIDRNKLNQVVQSGGSQLLYQREWRDQTNQVIEASLRINILSSQYNGLAIRDLRLQFESGEPELKLAQRDELMFAFAEVSYQGRGGTLSYQWEIAEPAGNQGAARYFVLQAGQRSLRGASPQRIRSPRLPTWVQGQYELRFVIQQPDKRVAQLRYQVRPNQVTTDLALLTPKPAAVLQSGQIFSWKPHAQARAYQLEIYEDDLRLSGVLIAADEQPGTPLSQLARQRLDQGCDCRWRVIAYGEDGRIVALSKLQGIKIPPR